MITSLWKKKQLRETEKGKQIMVTVYGVVCTLRENDATSKHETKPILSEDLWCPMNILLALSFWYHRQ